MKNPHDSTTPPNWVPAALAAGVLVAGYVVGPALGWLLSRAACAVDDALVYPDLD